MYNTIIAEFTTFWNGKILRDYQCIVAEKIEGEENFKIKINPCQNDSSWEYDYEVNILDTTF